MMSTERFRHSIMAFEPVQVQRVRFCRRYFQNHPFHPLVWQDLRPLMWIAFLMVCSFVEWNLALYYIQQWMTQLCSLQLCLQVMLRRQQPGETWWIVHLHSWDDKLFMIKYVMKIMISDYRGYTDNIILSKIETFLPAGRKSAGKNVSDPDSNQ